MTFSVHTLGCKVNSCESAAIIDAMLAAGYERAAGTDVADICIINSCTVTGMSVKKARQAISGCKTGDPGRVVVLCGCFPQAYPDEAKDTAADIIIGNTSKADIPFLVGEYLKNPVKRVFVNPLSRDFDERCAGVDLDRTRAFIKIEDGCDRFCTYCIIPTARGRVRSEKLSEITRKAMLAAESGHKEIVLTGINLSCYGQDLGLTLGDAVKAADVDGIERIRLGSLEPDMMTDSEIEKLKAVDKLCPHFHLSLQSGSDTVLVRMNRKYTTEEYAQSVDILKKYYDAPAITTDIIVGFPQETEEEFSETMEFAKRIGFSKIHVFKYSRRKGTVADKMSGQIEEQVKNTRSERLMALEAALGETYREQFLGREEAVLFEESTVVDGEVCQVGYNERYVRIAAKTKEDLSNCIRTVKIEKKTKEQETLFAKI